MTDSSTTDITELLRAWSAGQPDALDRLTPMVYRELHRLAVHYMSREKPGHPLQATALVNEAYMRLIDWQKVSWQNRTHFYAASAQVMRRILVDYARSRLYAKRGGNARLVSLDDAPEVTISLMSLLDLDIAMNRLASLDARAAQVVELRYFGGLGVEEAAEVLNVSPVTVIRSWNFAKAWLLRELSSGERGSRTPGAN
jgi:RNA polymerase sigma factor (TIGR02999 family)